MDLGQLDRIFEYRFIQSSSYSFPVTNVELEYMFDTLGFLWLHHGSPPYLLYLLEKLVDGLFEERTRPPPLRSITTTNQSFNMEPATAADMCDGTFKSKIITVYGNATVVKQTGPKPVDSAEQRKTLEMMVIVEEKCLIAQ